MLDEEHPAVHVVRVLCKLGLGSGDPVRVDRHDGQVLTGIPLLFSNLLCLHLNLPLAAESTLSSVPLFSPTTSALPQRYPHF